jgi:hypothetical protein
MLRGILVAFVAARSTGFPRSQEILGLCLGLSLMRIERLVSKYCFDFSIRAIVSYGALSAVAIFGSVSHIAGALAARQCILIAGACARVGNSGAHIPIRAAPTSHVKSARVIYVLPNEQARFKAMRPVIPDVAIRCSAL